MKKTIPTLVAIVLAATGFQSCLKSEHEDYEQWRHLNDEYLATLNRSEYQLIIPDWAPQNSVYIKWHNDRSLTASNLVPMSTSTVDIKYELEDIEGTKYENTYSRTDSTYTTQPNGNVTGMLIALTTMHVGDSVTLVVPYSSGYGSGTGSSGTLKPYTNLIFHMKLKGIKAYERPNN